MELFEKVMKQRAVGQMLLVEQKPINNIDSWDEK